MKQQHMPQHDLPNVLNATQLAHTLGISRAGAYNLMNQKTFPTLRIGGRKLVTKQHLLAWMDKQVEQDGGGNG